MRDPVTGLDVFDENQMAVYRAVRAGTYHDSGDFNDDTTGTSHPAAAMAAAHVLRSQRPEAAAAARAARDPDGGSDNEGERRVPSDGRYAAADDSALHGAGHDRPSTEATAARAATQAVLEQPALVANEEGAASESSAAGLSRQPGRDGMAQNVTKLAGDATATATNAGVAVVPAVAAQVPETEAETHAEGVTVVEGAAEAETETEAYVLHHSDGSDNAAEGHDSDSDDDNDNSDGLRQRFGARPLPQAD